MRADITTCADSTVQKAMARLAISQGVEVDTYGTRLLATTTHQAVVGNLLLEHIVSAVTQEIYRLNVVYAELQLQLAGVDTYAAARARLHLEIIVRLLLIFGL